MIVIFKNSIALKKTENAFLQQVDTFSKYFTHYEKVEENYIFKLEGQDAVMIHQEKQISLFSRLFRLEINLDVYNTSGFEDFECRLRLLGIPTVSGNFRCIRGSTQFAESINNSQAMNELNRIFNMVHIEFLSIKYEKLNDRVRIKVVPYPGSVVWLIIPPVSYYVKIRDDEIKAILELIHIIYGYLKQYKCQSIGMRN